MKKVLLGLGTSLLLLGAVLFFRGEFLEYKERMDRIEVIKENNAMLERSIQDKEEKLAELDKEKNELLEELERVEAEKDTEPELSRQEAEKKLKELQTQQHEMREKAKTDIKDKILDALKSQYEHDLNLSKTLNTMSPSEQEAYLLEAYQKRVAEIEEQYAPDVDVTKE